MATNKPGQGAWGPSRTSLGCQSEPLAGPWAELSISSWNLTTVHTSTSPCTRRGSRVRPRPSSAQPHTDRLLRVVTPNSVSSPQAHEGSRAWLANYSWAAAAPSLRSCPPVSTTVFSGTGDAGVGVGEVAVHGGLRQLHP